MRGRRGNRWCLCIEGVLKDLTIMRGLRETTRGNAKAAQLETGL